MQGALTTTLSELPESRVRVQVQVGADEVEGRIERQARQVGQRLKLPGFRRGKVPAPLVIQRVGRAAIFEEAIRSALGGWYASAIEDAGIVPVGDPSVELGDAPAHGEPFRFSIEVGVLPNARPGPYKGLEVPRAEPVVSEPEIDEEVQRLRERLARLEDIDGRADRGDFVVIDYDASGVSGPIEGGQARDQLVELGDGKLVPSLEQGLLGASAGEERALAVEFPVDYPNRELAGSSARFAVKVKQVKRKQLPELDDDFAADTGFDSMAELREDIRQRLRAVAEERVERDFREAALDEAARRAEVSIPRALIDARAREMWERTLRALERQGVSREAYLKLNARSEDELLGELAPSAEQALRREAMITAVVEAERIAVEDEELLEVLRSASDHAHEHEHHEHEDHADHNHAHAEDPQRLLAELRRTGRLEELREELAARKVVELIVSSAKPIAPERAHARAKLWTPDSEGEREPEHAAHGAAAAPSAGGERKKRIWTPRSNG